MKKRLSIMKQEKLQKKKLDLFMRKNDLERCIKRSTANLRGTPFNYQFLWIITFVYSLQRFYFAPLFLYALGVMFKIFLKVFIKYDMLLKPQSKQADCMLFPSESRLQALEIRTVFKKSINVSPVNSLKSLQK